MPTELLYTLSLKAFDGQTQRSNEADVQPQPVATQDDGQAESQSPAKAMSCSLCSLNFPTIQEQRSHVKSDLHHYNLKQKMRGLKPVTENDFERLIGELDESISGSESPNSDSEDEVEGSKDSTLTALLKRQAKLNHAEESGLQSTRQTGAGKAPLIWFSSPKLPENTSLGVYRAVFTDHELEEPSVLVETIKRKQLAPLAGHSNARQPPKSAASSPHFFLCMIGGGHFAAMIVSLQPKMTKKAGGIPDRQAVVLAHKTFHRYTVRRKQGGSQSASDASKGAAHSAGSSLRRYNEAALTNEVRTLLAQWKSMIDSAELCFVRATGTTNRQTLFGVHEGQALRQNDSRLRGFPFSTRRATQSELMRAFVELTRVKVSTIDEAALAAQAQADKKSEKTLADVAANKLAKPVKLSEEDEAALLHTQQIQALIRRSKAPALHSYIKSNNVPPQFKFFPAAQNHHTPTPLHLAASSSSAAIVTMLLTKAAADPTLQNDEGRTAYELAGDRATRDAFRLARHHLGEDAWPWPATAIPAALSPAEAESRAQRDRAEREADGRRQTENRAAETERLRREDAAKEETRHERKHGRGKQLASVLPSRSTQEKREDEARNLTPEMHARLERERRARAAEERLKRL